MGMDMVGQFDKIKVRGPSGGLMFYQQLDKIERLLDNIFNVVDFGQGFIRVNNVLIDTNKQLDMLTPIFFIGTAANNAMIKSFMEFFKKTGILPQFTADIPIIRDIPLRSKTMDARVKEQHVAFADFLAENILTNQWSHLFPDDYIQLSAAIRANYLAEKPPLEAKIITHDEEGGLLQSGGYRVEKHQVNGIDLWLHLPENNLEKDIAAAVEKSLNDTTNTKTMIEHLKPRLKIVNRLAFNVRGVSKSLYTREAIQNTDLGGGHQYFLLLDRESKTIYGINNTRGASDDDMLEFKAQIELFLKSIGDDIVYKFQYMEGKSRQPQDHEYLAQVCSISQFCHYAAVLAGVAVRDIKETVPAKVTTLMYLLQYASVVQDQKLDAMLNELMVRLNQKVELNPQHITIISEHGFLEESPHDEISVDITSNLNDQLNLIMVKFKSLDQEGQKVAAQCAKQLYDIVKESSEEYCSKQSPTAEDKEIFNKACTQAIRIARPVLEPHGGWKQALKNLALAIVLLVVGYPVAMYLNYRRTGHYVFFTPPPIHKLDELQYVIKTIARSAS